MSLTGDPSTDAMVAPAMALVWAARQNQGDLVSEAFLAAALHTDGDLYRAAAGLALVLAAMVPDDREAADLLAWTGADRDRYLELRATGLSSAEAAAQATPVEVPETSADVVPIRRGR